MRNEFHSLGKQSDVGKIAITLRPCKCESSPHMAINTNNLKRNTNMLHRIIFRYHHPNHTFELLADVNCAMSLCIDLTRRRWMSV